MNIDLFSSSYDLEHNPLNQMASDPSGFIKNQAQDLGDWLLALPKMAIDAIISVLTDPGSVFDLLIKFPGTLLGSLADFVDNIPILGDIVGAITGIFGGDLSDLATFFTDLLDFLEDIPIIGDIVQAVTGFFGGLGDLANWAGSLLNDFTMIPARLLGLIPFSHIGPTQPNLLIAGGFENAVSVQGSGIWLWDNTRGLTAPGSVKIVANGSEQRLLSNTIPVSQGDKLSHTISASWTGVAFSGVPFRTRMVRILDHAQVGVDNLASPIAPGTNQPLWQPVTGAGYTVPAGVDEICYELYVPATTTAGTIWFDDGAVRKTGLLQIPWTEHLPDSLQDLLDGAQSTIDTIFEGITGFPIIGGLLGDILNAFRNIPHINILGVGGPANVGASIQETWDQWIGGLVGEIGTGAGLSDLFNIGQQVSSWSSLGRQAWDVLGIRNNKPMSSGMLPTSSSNISLDQIAFTSAADPSGSGGISITQSTARRVYKRVEDYSPIGVVSWTGAGTTNVTDFYVNIFKLDQTTGTETLVHASSNIVGDIGSSLSTNIYELSTPIETVPGEVYAYELSLRGAGTHKVAGNVSWLPARNDMFPRKWAAVRNSGTSAPPSSIAIGSVTYAGETPSIEVAITTGGVDIPRSPEIRQFQTAGSLSVPIPTWVKIVEVVVLGGGGGGHQGGSWGIGGAGGGAGEWNAATWVRDVDFSGTTSIALTVGSRGGYGAPNGGNGGDSTASITGHSVTGDGGIGSIFFDPGGADLRGRSPGNYTYGTNPIPYVGGGFQLSYGGNGAAPGGGGAGGNWISFQAGGWGAVGSIWLRFRQS